MNRIELCRARAVSLLFALTLCAPFGCARLGAIYSSPEWMRPAGQPAAPVFAGAIRVAHVLDLRGDEGRRGHEPHQSKMFGFFTPVFMFGGGLEEGPNIAGDKRTNPAPAPWRQAGQVVPALDAWLIDTVSHGTGKRALRAELGAFDGGAGAVASAGDGLLIVPVLDQLDVVQMTSTDSISGGGRSQQGNTVTTTSGASSGTASTPAWINVRFRLALFEVAGGRIMRQSVAWLADTEVQLVSSGTNTHEKHFGPLATRAAGAVAAFAAAAASGGR